MSTSQEIEKHKIDGGRYVYCIVNCSTGLSLDQIGIDDAKVYTVPYRDIAAVVHVCSAGPYETNDNEKAKYWLFTHNYVIDKAMERFDTVLPLSFNAIIRGNDDKVKHMLSEGYKKLKDELERVRGKAEYTVQIFCDSVKLKEKILAEDQELKALKGKIEQMPKGPAYLFQRKFELKIKDMIMARIARLAEEFSSKIGEYVEEIKVEGASRVPEKYKEKKLIATLTCLVSNKKTEELGRILEAINNYEGYIVRFTGPWAPFSFIELKEI